MSPVLDDAPSPDEQGDDDAPATGGAAVGLDLSPRTGEGEGEGERRRGGGPAGGRRRWPWLIVVVVLVAAIGFVISRALTEATQFYVTADEAVARRAELADRSFRLEGTVVEGTVVDTGPGVSFRVAANGTEVAVDHVGDPPPLFQTCIPVVLEGRWSGTAADAPFASTAIIVAHDEQYEEANSERMEQARAQGAESNACAQKMAAAQP